MTLRWLSLLVVLGLPAVARAQTPAQLAQARQEFDAAQTAYDLARYQEAERHYARAYELSKLPAILYNLGQAHRRLYETAGAIEDLRLAREMYRSYLRLVPIASERPMAESLLKGVEDEYRKQLHAQRDRLLTEATGPAALNLADDFLAQNDLDAAETALARFVKTPGNRRAEVARGLRVEARLRAARGDGGRATESFARALELDPSTAPPPETEPAARTAFAAAEERMRGQKPLALAHVPPGRSRIGVAPKLRIDVVHDPLGLVRALEVRYRAGGGAFAAETVKPGEVTFPPAFNSGLVPGTRLEYYVTAVDDAGAQLDTLGSAALPFVLAVDAKPPVPAWRRWYFWVGLGAGVLAVAGAATAIGITQAPPERVGIPVVSGLGGR